MSHWLFNAYMDDVMKEVKMGMERRGVSFLEDGREWRLSGLLYADDLVLCGESEEDLRVMVGRYAEDVWRHDEMLDNEGLAIKIHREEVDGNNGRGKPKS